MTTPALVLHTFFCVLVQFDKYPVGVSAGCHPGVVNTQFTGRGLYACLGNVLVGGFNVFNL